MAGEPPVQLPGDQGGLPLPASVYPSATGLRWRALRSPGETGLDPRPMRLCGGLSDGSHAAVNRGPPEPRPEDRLGRPRQAPVGPKLHQAPLSCLLRPGPAPGDPRKQRLEMTPQREGLTGSGSPSPLAVQAWEPDVPAEQLSGGDTYLDHRRRGKGGVPHQTWLEALPRPDRRGPWAGPLASRPVCLEGREGLLGQTAQGHTSTHFSGPQFPRLKNGSIRPARQRQREDEG